MPVTFQRQPFMRGVSAYDAASLRRMRGMRGLRGNFAASQRRMMGLGGWRLGRALGDDGDGSVDITTLPLMQVPISEVTPSTSGTATPFDATSLPLAPVASVGPAAMNYSPGAVVSNPTSYATPQLAAAAGIPVAQVAAAFGIPPAQVTAAAPPWYANTGMVALLGLGALALVLGMAGRR